MFEDELGLYNENSLDLLLRFGSENEQDEDRHSTDLFCSPYKDLPCTEDLLEEPLKDTHADPLAG
jgi:hypothetical protein